MQIQAKIGGILYYNGGNWVVITWIWIRVRNLPGPDYKSWVIRIYLGRQTVLPVTPVMLKMSLLQTALQHQRYHQAGHDISVNVNWTHVRPTNCNSNWVRDYWELRVEQELWPQGSADTLCPCLPLMTHV